MLPPRATAVAVNAMALVMVDMLGRRLDIVRRQLHALLSTQKIEQNGNTAVTVQTAGEDGRPAFKRAARNPHPVPVLQFHRGADGVIQINHAVALAPANFGNRRVRHLGRRAANHDHGRNPVTLPNPVPLQLNLDKKIVGESPARRAGRAPCATPAREAHRP
jgi:hypothetical protein